MSVEDVDDAVQAASVAFAIYRKYTPIARSRLLSKWYSLICQSKEDISRILVYETGKPIAEARGEVEYAASFTRWFAGEAERIQGTTYPAAISGRRIFTIKQPIGVVAALTPWNFPVATIVRKASGAFAAGCTVIAKPSPETPLSVLTLAYLAEKAGFPSGVFNVLPTTLDNTPALSEALCKHPTVKKLSFTGSTRVGKIISAHCADSLKKLTLELGGNCPFLVFDDADLEQACRELMHLKFRHAGQACITANRVYVQRTIYEKFANLLAEKTRKLRVGHGLDEATTMGPLTVLQGIDKTLSQVEDARKHGGTILTGGNRVESLGTGYFFEPTIITNATASMKIASEETFGPVLALFPFDMEEEAVKAANNTSVSPQSWLCTGDRRGHMDLDLLAGVLTL
ncbi:aldehyde dehydrogenase [Xylaria nigripes]|nr:aldehyde dehydrogenase [Xylaria nigripes]